MKKTIILANSLCVILLLLGFVVKAQLTGGKMNVSGLSLVQQQQKIMIKWMAVDSKSQTKYFEVEKSVDGKNFKTVAYILGADPKEKDDCFSCFDKITAKSKEAYYRVKQVTEKGTVQYSETKILAIK